MEKDFIPYEQALDLKELGFDEPCFGFYENEILKPTSYVNDFNNGTNHNVDFDNVFKTIKAPTFSQAFRWFREKYKIECYVNCYWSEEDSTKRTYFANYNYGSDIFYSINIEFKTYEEAELECLKKLIEIVKNGN